MMMVLGFYSVTHSFIHMTSFSTSHSGLFTLATLLWRELLLPHYLRFDCMPLPQVESCRVGCVDSGVVGGLVGGLGSTDTSVALQACRALGNICYEHGQFHSLCCVGQNRVGELQS